MKALTQAGLLLGIGLGGFFDGIVFHQILQWHNMLSAKVPPHTMEAMRFNMLWDGVFHAAVWCVTVAGVWRLFGALQRRDAPASHRTLLGGMACGCERPWCTPGLRMYQTLMEKSRSLRLLNQARLRQLVRHHPEVQVSCSHDPDEFERLTGRAQGLAIAGRPLAAR